MGVDYDIQKCHLARTLTLEPIRIGDTGREGEGIRVAMSGTNGQFIVVDDINSSGLWIMTDREAVGKIFED